MKRILFTALLLIIFSAALFARKLVAEGKTSTILGDFKIETADQPVKINGVDLDTYVVTYSKTNMTVTIAIEKNRKCMATSNAGSFSYSSLSESAGFVFAALKVW